MTRYVSITSRITGWNAVKSRINQLKLDGFSDEDIKAVYVSYYLMENVGDRIKALGKLDTNILGTGLPRSSSWPTVSTLHYPILSQLTEVFFFVRPLAIDDADSIIHAYHLSLKMNSAKDEVAA